MCGFAAIQSKDKGNASKVRGMIDQLVHRGPDERGTWKRDEHGIYMSQCRLSIIDIEGGKQPMEASGNTIIYNGEIYNYKALRKDLRSSGYQFETESDTEVFLQGYCHWGTDVFDKVRGMFAVVIWDEKSEQLIMGRDHLGQKPLLYYSDNNTFIVASEIQGLLSLDEIPHSADFASLSWYLSMGYIPSPRTGFAKIKKLPPGNYMVIEDSEIRQQVRYWDPTKLSQNDTKKPSLREIRTTLKQSVERRMISDVPLGAFLSGGVDSSIITGLMSKKSNDPIKTISVGFQNDLYDETDFAQTVADRFGTDHHNFKLSIDLQETLPNLIQHFGEPFADSSAIPTYYLAQKTRNVVKVALSGDGGDEVFGGYRRYFAMRSLDSIRNYSPKWLLRLIQSCADLFGSPPDRRSNWGERIRVLQMLAEEPPYQYLNMVGLGGEKLKSWLAEGPLKRPAARSGDHWLGRWFRRFSHLDDMANRSMAVDLMSYLPGDLLVKTDITTMMNSLECRSPFLDRDVVELGLNLDPEDKVRGKNTKHILKEAFRDMLPESIKNRAKQGFGVPLKEWFIRGDKSDYLSQVIKSRQSNFESIIDRESLLKLLQRHQNQDVDASPILWSLTVLKIWMKQFQVRV